MFTKRGGNEKKKILHGSSGQKKDNGNTIKRTLDLQLAPSSNDHAQVVGLEWDHTGLAGGLAGVAHQLRQREKNIIIRLIAFRKPSQHVQENAKKARNRKVYTQICRNICNLQQAHRKLSTTRCSTRMAVAKETQSGKYKTVLQQLMRLG